MVCWRCDSSTKQSKMRNIGIQRTRPRRAADLHREPEGVRPWRPPAYGSAHVPGRAGRPGPGPGSRVHRPRARAGASLTFGRGGPACGRPLKLVVGPREAPVKLEYLIAGSPDCPLLRLYDFTPAEASQLHEAVAALASGASERIELHRLPFVELLGGCRLTLACRSWDQAVVHEGRFAEFVCGFTPSTWEQVVDLIEPFAIGTVGFQWLAGAPGEAMLLLSTSGDW